MKRILSVFLCAALICCTFAACGGDSGSSGSAGSKASSAGTSSAAGDSSAPAAGNASEEAIAARTEPVKLTMCFMNFIGAQDATNEVVEEMNKITREKLGIEIELQILDSASYKQQMTLMLSGGEQVDLFNAITVGYSNCINNGYVIDLEEDDLIQTYGQGIIDEIGQKYVDACRFGGTLYGVPQQRDMAIGMNAYAIGSQYLDGIGFEYTDDNINKVTAEQIEDILAQLHEKYPDKAVIGPQTATLGQSVKFDAIGGDNFGVLLDPENSLEVGDLFSSDLYKDFCQKWYDWNQKGYLSGDALTNDVAATTQVRSGTLLGYQTATKPGIRVQESNLCGQPMVILQEGEDFLKAGAVASMPWCISLNTVDKVAAMQYLNELYTNPELSTLLCWGREGVEYQKTEDGHLTYAEGVTADTTGYQNNVNWELPNQFIAGVWEGDELDLWDQMKKFNDEAVTSKALGFTFDNTTVSTEFTALTNIYNEYQKQLEFGFSDPATTIPEMVQKMNDAGLEKYMAEKKAQLEQWASDSGVS